MIHIHNIWSARLAGAALSFLLMAGFATGQVSVTSISSQFGYFFDDTELPNDQQATQRSIDLVGQPGSTLAAFYTHVNTDSLVFRMRLNEANMSGGVPTFNQVAAIGIDLGSTISGSPINLADLAFAVSGKNGPGVSRDSGYFMAIGSSNATSPSTTSWGSAFNQFALNSSNFNYSLASSIDGAIGNVAGSVGPNAYLTFSLSFTQLEAAIQSLGVVNGVDYSTYSVNYANAVQFRYSVHTGTQSNAVNVDTLQSGQIVPEASTIAFLFAGVLPLLAFRMLPPARRASLAKRLGFA
jgi:hypothetical protein